MSNAIGEWLIHISNLSKTTQSGYKQVICDFAAGFHYLEDIKAKDIRYYITKIIWNHKKSTSNKYLKVLKSFFSFAAEEYNIPNPILKIRMVKENLPHQPFISRQQYLKILESATQKESDIIKILANTGLRASELCGLKPENISPNLSSMRIQGKGSKVRTIPCNQTVREILSRNINLPKSLPKNRKSIYNICKNAGDKAQVHLAPHVLRRFFATQLLNKGVSLLIISRLLGHSSVQTTEQYLKIDSSYLHGVTDVLD